MRRVIVLCCVACGWRGEKRDDALVEVRVLVDIDAGTHAREHLVREPDLRVAEILRAEREEDLLPCGSRLLTRQGVEEVEEGRLRAVRERDILPGDHQAISQSNIHRISTSAGAWTDRYHYAISQRNILERIQAVAVDCSM